METNVLKKEKKKREEYGKTPLREHYVTIRDSGRTIDPDKYPDPDSSPDPDKYPKPKTK